MNILVSHPTGNRNVRSIISSFHKADLLAQFATTVSITNDTWWLQLLPSKIKSELLRRNYQLNPNLIWTHPLREMIRMIAPKIGWNSIIRYEAGWASIDAVYQDFDLTLSKQLSSFVQKKKLNAVYCYEDGALHTFKGAKRQGLFCIYDLPIAYWETSRRLLFEEAERMPAWKETLGGGIKNSEKKLERKTKELELADVVIGPGQFVIDSIPDWAKNKNMIVSPFGSPEINLSSSNNNIDEISLKKRPLRILFVGSMGQRKGLGDLMKAMHLLKSQRVELVIMGSLLESIDFYRSQFSSFTYEVGRAHNEVLALMRSCDVFCLPSVVEGRALVMQEAMSQGLPLIITPNTGGQDLIIEGKTGFLVPIRSPEKIAEKIDWFASHQEEMKAMGQAAKLHASTYAWNAYGQKIVTQLKLILN